MIPNYKKIYTDIIKEKYPEKSGDSQLKNSIEQMNTVIDIFNVDKLIFGEVKCSKEIGSQQLRSYDKNSILEILNYQKKNNLNNTELANHFNISRNSITKWKKFFSPSVS